MADILKQVLKVTAAARDAASHGDFAGVERLVKERGELLQSISFAKKNSFTREQKAVIKKDYLDITRLDKEITNMIKYEIEQGNKDMMEIGGKLKALMAYSKNFPLSRQFNRIL